MTGVQTCALPISLLITKCTQGCYYILKVLMFWNHLSNTVLGHFVCAWLELLCSSIACSIICLKMMQQKNFIYVTVNDSECRSLFQITCLIISTEQGWLPVRFHEITFIHMGTPARCPPISVLSFFFQVIIDRIQEFTSGVSTGLSPEIGRAHV